MSAQFLRFLPEDKETRAKSLTLKTLTFFFERQNSININKRITKRP